ncbi:MAG: glycosyltransferase [Clostridia bacterium]|nr:glycosyltransferase [Clostridia bacterium]
MKKISIVVPCYNEEKALVFFYEETEKAISQMQDCAFEYVFVDDGSKDKTLKVLKEFAEKDEKVRYLSFSRNFGKESAIYAGLKNATGDFVVLMDADLQDPPALLPELYQAVKDGEYDCAALRRVTRKGEPPIRSFFARRFYKLMNKISDVELVDGARDYRMMSRRFVSAVLSLGEKNRFSKGIFGWVGFKTKWFEYENVERVAGETKWSFFKLFKYSLQGIVAFSSALLQIATVFGLLLCGLSFFGLIALTVLHFALSAMPVWSFLLCAIVMGVGICIFFTGVLGLYVDKIHTETRNRPIYIEQDGNITK